MQNDHQLDISSLSEENIKMEINKRYKVDQRYFDLKLLIKKWNNLKEEDKLELMIKYISKQTKKSRNLLLKGLKIEYKQFIQLEQNWDNKLWSPMKKREALIPLKFKIDINYSFYGNLPYPIQFHQPIQFCDNILININIFKKILIMNDKKKKNTDN